jgi:hypothetical protein
MKTIIANTTFKHGETNFIKGDLFDIDELGCNLVDLQRLIKGGYVTWGEYVAPKVTKKETTKVSTGETSSKTKRTTPTPRTKKTDKSES